MTTEVLILPEPMLTKLDKTVNDIMGDYVSEPHFFEELTGEVLFKYAAFLWLIQNDNSVYYLRSERMY